MPRSYITIGICAPVDAGKTTLSENLLFLGNAIRKMGRVDDMDTFLDNDAMERERGITIISKQAQYVSPFSDGEREYTILDTPGHDDLTPEAERVLSVLDCAILLISGPDGVNHRVAELWKLLAHYEVPVIIFVNKMDQLRARGEDDAEDRIMEEIRSRLTGSAMEIGDLSDEATAESLALCDEELLEKVYSGGIITDADVSALITERKVFPVVFGSALKGENTEELQRQMDRFIKMPSYPGEFGARVFKTGRGRQGERLTFMKITGGELKPRAEIRTAADDDGRPVFEKVTEIRIYSGEKYERTDSAGYGRICAVTGLENTRAGSGLGFEEDDDSAVVLPSVKWVIEAEGEDPIKAYRLLKTLEVEEPLLNIQYNERTREITGDLTGDIQKDVIRRRAADMLGLTIDFVKPRVIYKETVKGPVEGVGHFEPLRHYAEVHLLLEPLPRGSGMEFGVNVAPDTLASNWQNLVLTHLKERRFRGVLTGAEITDMRITLVAGKAHLKHTEGGDFRQAVYRAVRQGLMAAESMLLEPVYEFTVTLPAANVGTVMNDLEHMGARFSLPEFFGDDAVITGRAPVSELDTYPATLRTFTGGKGRISLSPGGYEECHNADEVIRDSGYDPDADVRNPSSSVFCSHGSGDIIPWDQVYRYMAIPYVTEHHPEEVRWDLPQDEQATSSGGGVVSDKELMAIFEKTYGPVKTRLQSDHAMRPQKDASYVYRAPKRKKEKHYLLVDGYNIIHAWEDLKELAGKDIKAARDKLLDILSNYGGYSRYNIVCVCDAYLVNGTVEKTFRYHNIDVVYTRE
ncbi:MAG: NYN domain-containing protein, partial [Lachnospiraceae bacterium]|nr:NYN domain-containing protein [Lachnospiraceae bacterium]